MAKKPKDPATATPQAEAPQEPVKPPKAILKVVELPLNEEYQEPEGWILKDIHNSDNTEKFYGVLVKIQNYPKPAGIRQSKPVNLKS